MPKKKADMASLEIKINRESPFRPKFALETFIKGILILKGITTGSVEFNFVSKETMKKLNQQYLDSSADTDIITFNLGTTKDIVGDIYISMAQAKENAAFFGNTLDNEVKLLITHGILHLLDYRDYTKAEKQIMEQEQERLLNCWHALEKICAR